MDNETKNPLNLSPEEQDALRQLLVRELNLRGRKLVNSVSSVSIGTGTTDQIVKFKDGAQGTLEDSFLNDLASALVKGDVLYASANNVLNKLGIGTSQQEMRVSSSGIPEWFTPSTNVSNYVPDSAAKGFVVGGNCLGQTIAGHVLFQWPGLAGASVYYAFGIKGFIRNFNIYYRSASVIGNVGIITVTGVQSAFVCGQLGTYPVQAAAQKLLNSLQFGYLDRFDWLQLNKTGTTDPVGGWSVEFITSDNSCFIAYVVTSAGASQQIAASTTRYVPFFAPSTAAAQLLKSSETDAAFVIPFAATISTLLAQFATAQDASGTLVLTVRKNGSDTALTITVPAGASSGLRYADFTNSFTVAAGDYITIKAVNNATVASTRICFASLKIVSNTGTYYIGGNSIDASLTGTLYFCPFLGSTTTGTDNPDTTETDVTFPMARAGTLRNLYIYVVTDGSGTVKIFKNGSATSLSISLGTGTGVKSDLVNTVTIAQSDTISLEINVTSGTPVISSWSAEFV